jgi:hypothetical protein
MWNTYYFMNTYRKISISLLFLVTFLISGCSMFRRSSSASVQDDKSSNSAQSSGGSTFVNPNAVETPKPFKEKRKISLVLGGAGVSSFATVGLLKRLHEEGIEIETIVTSGWPTLFVLAAGFLKSIHDVEWFAMRLQEKDFSSVSSSDPSVDYSGRERISSLIESNFKEKEINETKFALIIAPGNTHSDGNDTFDHGDWKTPLLKTMAVPGLFRPYPTRTQDQDWIQSIQGMNVEEAKRRSGRIIVAVEMYDDYFSFLKTGKKDSSNGVFRQLYLGSLKKSVNQQLKEANLGGRIQLMASPTNFAEKRLAIFAGYKEGARLAKAIRSLSNN